MDSIQFVDVEAARAARGLRLIVSGVIASPWSEAAKGLFHVKGIPALGVRFRRGNDELRAWTGAHNVPVVLFDDEPPRTAWADILALAERLGGRASLVPVDPEARVRMYGLLHELASEGGLGWQSRLIMLHGSFTTGGARSFPLPIAEYLAPKYGYTPERAEVARGRIRQVLALCDQQLARSRAAGHAFMMGEAVGALDIYVAAFLTPPLGTEVDCPEIRPDLRAGFAYLAAQVAAEVPASLAAHRALMFREHLPWPIRL